MPYNQTAVGMGSANAGQGRDRITQALMAIQNPPPVNSMPQQPPPVMGPPGGGGGMTAAPGVGGAGTMPGAMPQQAPMMPQMNAAVPGAMQPGGAMAPGMGMPGMGQQQQPPMAQPPAMGAQY